METGIAEIRLAMKILMMLVFLAIANPADPVAEWDHLEKSVSGSNYSKRGSAKALSSSI